MTDIPFSLQRLTFPFQVFDVLERSHNTDVAPRGTVHRVLHPHAGVHDLQRVALHSARPRAGSRLLLLRLEEEHRGRRHRALPMTPGTPVASPSEIVSTLA